MSPDGSAGGWTNGFTAASTSCYRNPLCPSTIPCPQYCHCRLPFPRIHGITENVRNKRSSHRHHRSHHPSRRLTHQNRERQGCAWNPPRPLRCGHHRSPMCRLLNLPSSNPPSQYVVRECGGDRLYQPEPWTVICFEESRTYRLCREARGYGREGCRGAYRPKPDGNGANARSPNESSTGTVGSLCPSLSHSLLSQVSLFYRHVNRTTQGATSLDW